MHDLAITLRAAQLYTHAAHLQSHGPTSHQDHELFGEFYKEHEEAFDGLVELMIGTGYKVDQSVLTKEAAKEAGSYSFDGMPNEACFRNVEKFEQEIRQLVANYSDSVDEGTENVLQQIASDSLHRSYHINRRLS